MVNILKNAVPALIVAATNNDTEYAVLLLAQGENVNQKDQFNNTPLHVTASAGYKELSCVLILYGADVNAVNNDLVTPLHYAVASHHKEIVTILINCNVNINILDKYHHSPSDYAKILNIDNILPLLNQNSSIKIDNKIKIALSYNRNIGGVAADAIIHELSTSDIAEVCIADYRLITPEVNNDLDQYVYDNFTGISHMTFNNQFMLNLFSNAKHKAQNILSDCDGLIIPGNVFMIDPRLFGATVTPNILQCCDLARNIAEMALIHVAVQCGMPILGICGGHQILNTYFGGTIHDKNNSTNRSITIVRGSELEKIIFKISNNISHLEDFYLSHNQIVSKIGGLNIITHNQNLLTVSAHANDNIYAVEQLFGAPIIGVQFHPEISRYCDNFTIAQKIRDKSIYRAYQQSAKTYHAKKVILSELKEKAYSNNQEHKAEQYKQNNYHDIIYNHFNDDNILECFNNSMYDSNIIGESTA